MLGLYYIHAYSPLSLCLAASAVHGCKWVASVSFPTPNGVDDSLALQLGIEIAHLSDM